VLRAGRRKRGDTPWLLVGIMLLSLLGQLLLDSRRRADESVCETLYRLTGIVITQDCDPFGDAGDGSRDVNGGTDIMAMEGMPMAHVASGSHAPHHQNHSYGTCPLCLLLHLTALVPIDGMSPIGMVLGWVVVRARLPQPRAPPARRLVVHQPRGPPDRHGYAMPADFARVWSRS